MSFTTVITHDTAFHADEIIAVALLRQAGYQFELIRTRAPKVLEAAVADKNTLVLDVGGVYDPEMLNFDHHQNKELLSAAGLIYEHFKNEICPVDAQAFFGRFISSIDVMDTNRDNIFEIWSTLPKGFKNTSGILGGFNRDMTDAPMQYQQFLKATDIAQEIIGNEIYSSVKKAKSESDYQFRTVLDNNVAVFDQFSTVWKDKKEHIFAVLPHANGWQLQTVDTLVAVVPERITQLDGFVFRHISGFMAVVKDKAVLVEFARSLDRFQF
ncbi:MYG1 family protein [Dyadobacter sp. CY356]|uniref:MYG1 family protein n=1 Tax=Dyadobacter sp. CY356 TaxID=2906442 RepID=UPI001F31B83E|nr:MYG1 family protein [Dyadobacter sp. CY356]MCF0056073.1 MYG1 family protein [Dyadobacter sp. CY356]